VNSPGAESTPITEWFPRSSEEMAIPSCPDDPVTQTFIFWHL
jgi:hypothetical protein